MRLFSFIEEEKGSVIIIVASALAAFMAVAALAIDVGLLYQERRQLQTAVDSSSLAAAQELAEGGLYERADEIARGYVIENSQVTPDSIVVDFPSNNSVKVVATTTRKLFFAKVLGRGESSLKATATAAYGTATAVRNLVPIIVPLQFVYPHIGTPGTFELGNDRPLEAFRKSAAQIGNEILYTITFVNTGTSPTGVTITDSIPPATAYVDGSALEDGSYDGSANSITWRLDSVGAGDYVSVSFKVSISDGPASGIRNTAEATTDSGRKYHSSTTGAAQKGFFWLSDFDTGSGGTPDYASWIEGGYPKEVGVGHVANGEGVKAALKAALESRMPDELNPERNHVVIPVYDYTEGGGSPGKYHIAGFVEFVITGFDLTGSPKTITGYFTDGTVAAGAGGGTLPDVDFGIKAVWLVD